jgi:hypothetical protein
MDTDLTTGWKHYRAWTIEPQRRFRHANSLFLQSVKSVESVVYLFIWFLDRRNKPGIFLL